MPFRVLLSDVLKDGASLRPHEAVAIVQKLIHNPDDSVPRPPFGPPTPETVYLNDDGSVTCDSYEVTPAVSEIGILLDAMLPPGTPRVPGGLRYTIARALLDVEAPPFDSVHELSHALARFETGDRDETVRQLVARARLGATGPRPVVAPPEPRFDRRRTMPSPTELRRALREADARLYEHVAVDAATIVPEARTPRRYTALVAGLAAGIALIASGEAMHVLRSHTRVAPAVATASIAPTDQTPPHSIATAGLVPSAPTVPPSAAMTFHSPRRTTASGSAHRAVASARADAGSEDHIRSSEPGTLVAALDVHQRPVFSPAFASNGSAVFFQSGPTDRRSALMSAAGGPGDLRVMTILDDGARNYHVQPSPDGRRIAFDSDRDGERGVYIADRDGSHVQRVTGPGYAAVPTWSPDGRQIAFVRAERDNAKVWNLWLLTLATGDMQPLTHYRYGQTWSASWFSDGRRVAYTHEDELVVLDLTTGNRREFASPVKGRLVRTPAVSPDDRHVVFQVYRNGAWLLDLTDGTMRCVLTDPTAEEFAWSPDGRRVAFHSRRDGEWGIWIMAPQG